VLALCSGLLCLLWVLVAGIALYPQPMSESALLLFGNQLRHIHTHILRVCSGRRLSLLLRGSSVLALYSGLLCLLWALVARIALNPQPVSGSASLLSGNQLRQAMILLAWICLGLAQAEAKRSLKAIVYKILRNSNCWVAARVFGSSIL